MSIAKLKLTYPKHENPQCSVARVRHNRHLVHVGYLSYPGHERWFLGRLDSEIFLR